VSTTGAKPWVADLYDAYVNVDFDFDFFVDEARRAAGADLTSPVLELMVGTGRVSLPIVEAGVDLTCVELSGPMLARLQDKLTDAGLAATLIEADVSTMALPRNDYALALLPFNAFGELLNIDDQRATLAIVRDHLRPGGQFICTLHNPAIRRASVDGQFRLIGNFPLPTDREDGARELVMSSVQLPSADDTVVCSRQFYELYDADGRLMAKYVLDARFRLIPQADFEALATAAGFRITALYGNYDRSGFRPDTSPYMIWVLDRD